jgi:hypothetical protein
LLIARVARHSSSLQLTARRAELAKDAVLQTTGGGTAEHKKWREQVLLREEELPIRLDEQFASRPDSF